MMLGRSLIRGRMLRWAWLLLLVRFWLRRVLRLTPGLRLWWRQGKRPPILLHVRWVPSWARSVFCVCPITRATRSRSTLRPSRAFMAVGSKPFGRFSRESPLLWLLRLEPCCVALLPLKKKWRALLLWWRAPTFQRIPSVALPVSRIWSIAWYLWATKTAESLMALVRLACRVVLSMCFPGILRIPYVSISLAMS